MEFIMYCNFQETTMAESDHHQLLHRRSEPAGFEDDLYYAELERQILLLTADDDEEEDEVVAQNNGSVFGGKTLLPFFSPTAKHAVSADVAAVGTEYPMSENYGNRRGYAGTAVTWQKSNGTGVFIPQTIKSQTSHYKSTGRMNYGRRMKRQMENKIKAAGHVCPKIK